MEVDIKDEASVIAPAAAGFWRRTAAFLVDALLLGIVGMLAGWALFDVFARMGGYGRLLGFIVALAYFGVMNSARFSGQTLGKRLLRVRVVGQDGSLLSLPKSLLRYCVLGIPFFLNRAPIDVAALPTPFAYGLSLVVLGGIFSILYLYLFNRRGRRSLHDLAAGSCVVTASMPVGLVKPAPVWRVHLVVVGVLLAASAALPALTGPLAQNASFAGLLSAHKAILAQPGVQNAQVVHNMAFGSDGTASVKSVVAQVSLVDRRTKDAALAEHIARILLANDKTASSMSAIHVTLVHGYDIGIASSWNAERYRFTPEALAADGAATASGSAK